jgi:hypothetical protein
MRCRQIESSGEQCKLVSVKGDELCARHSGVEMEIEPLTYDVIMDLASLLARYRMEVDEWISSDRAWNQGDFKGKSDKESMDLVRYWEELLSHIEWLHEGIGRWLEDTLVSAAQDECADADPPPDIFVK